MITQNLIDLKYPNLKLISAVILLNNHGPVVLMSENTDKRHRHHGMSRKNFLNSEKILKDIGIDEGERFLDLGSGEGYFQSLPHGP
jgi:hypothetical protein